jgi:hypothetical protein
MCNAWNHYPGCVCGFGGEGHLGGNPGRGRRNPLDPIRSVLDDARRQAIKEFETFTIPNATCPVCGANVFFYQSPYGGRVFFDKLSPPWPKHPCTDVNFAAVKYFHKGSTEAVHARWMDDGWLPFRINGHRLVDGFILVLAEINEGQMWSTLGKLLIENVDELKFKNPLFYKEKGNGEFKLSTINNEGQEVIVRGWIRARITEICPRAIQYLRIAPGDRLDAEFKGTYKGIYLEVEAKGCVPKKACVIDKSKLSKNVKLILEKDPNATFDLACIVDRITAEFIFLREIGW